MALPSSKLIEKGFPVSAMFKELPEVQVSDLPEARLVPKVHPFVLLPPRVKMLTSSLVMVIALFEIVTATDNPYFVEVVLMPPRAAFELSYTIMYRAPYSKSFVDVIFWNVSPHACPANAVINKATSVHSCSLNELSSFCFIKVRLFSYICNCGCKGSKKIGD